MPPEPRFPSSNAACLTPGAVFTIDLRDASKVAAVVTLPFALGLDARAAKALENAIHDALEAALAPYFEVHR